MLLAWMMIINGMPMKIKFVNGLMFKFQCFVLFVTHTKSLDQLLLKFDGRKDKAQSLHQYLQMSSLCELQKGQRPIQHQSLQMYHQLLPTKRPHLFDHFVVLGGTSLF